MKPKFYNTLKGLFDDNPAGVKQSSSITIAEQISLGGARRFANMSQKDFIEWYLSNIRKHFFEIITEDKTKKLFMDIDIARSETDIKNPGELVINLIKLSSATIYRLTNIEVSREDWLVLNSSSNTKASYHIILNHVHLRFMDIGKMRSLVEYLITSFENEVGSLDTKRNSNKKIVDLSCYSKNQNFRFMYSSKLGKPNTLELDDRDENLFRHISETSNDITDEIFKASIITQYTKYPRLFDNMECFEEIFEKTRIGGKQKIDSITEKPSEPGKIDFKLEDFIKEKFNAKVTYRNDKALEKKIFVLLNPTLPCPYNDKIHSRNNVYVMIDLSRNSWNFICHNSECKKKSGISYLIEEKFIVNKNKNVI